MLNSKKVISCALAAMMSMQGSGLVFAGETNQLNNVKAECMLDKKIDLIETAKERICTSIENGKFVEAIYNKETKILTQKIYDKRGGNLLNSEVLDLSKPPRMANGYTWFGFGYEEQKDYYYLKSCNGSLKFPPKGDSAAHSYMNKVDEIWRIEVAGVLVVGAGIITGLLIKNGKIVETITKAAIIAVVGDKGPDVINAILNYHGLCREAERLFMEVPVV